MPINTRRKGQRNELLGREALKDMGFEVFNLYQPPYKPQGPIDCVAVGVGRVRFIQFRSNQSGDLRGIRVLKVLIGEEPLLPTYEVWVKHNREKHHRQRVL